MNDKQLLKRAVLQLTAWHEKYGANKAEWLPPAGDVRLLEDIDASLLADKKVLVMRGLRGRHDVPFGQL